MTVLVLRLAGPLQSWGSSARFARRTTEGAPTKSGVIGMLAAALGRDRGADLSDLAELAFAVRTDQPGTRLRDFQTAHHADTDKAMPVSERFYLADAVFLAAVAGDDELIRALAAAVRAPVYLPYLGRRSCPPQGPLDLGIRNGDDPAETLRHEPWQAAPWHQQRHRRQASVPLRIHADATPADTGRAIGDALRDQPLSFDPAHRRYALRTVVSTTVEVPNPAFRPDTRPKSAQGSRVPAPRHDPAALLTPLPTQPPLDGP
ncbi:type I-E CRISPR-associated protein Cas5/CasD [Streptomyces sp. NPDC012888]|uniref:type I-E CRISPR-associated protein Cas5/CasD n=1 Tax=Streptomyces sp. NPDC012888 TaxID=3364855 RepID=UPI0036B882AA